MTFSQALELMKQGKRVSCSEWLTKEHQGYYYLEQCEHPPTPFAVKKEDHQWLHSFRVHSIYGGQVYDGERRFTTAEILRDNWFEVL